MRSVNADWSQIFLERSTARVINTDTLKPPNPDCTVCGVLQSKLIVDPARATLNHLVQDVLKTQLGYSDEFSVNNELGILYDPELDDNLLKKFSDLGIKGDSFLTVIDDEEENPRINVSFVISEQYVHSSPTQDQYNLIATEPYPKTPTLFLYLTNSSLLENLNLLVSHNHRKRLTGPAW